MPDRDEVIKAIEACMDQFHPAYCNECYLDGYRSGITCREKLMGDALALLREHDVIRCKDCLHRSENHRCYADNPMRGQYVGNDWFCADGKRKEGR